ncbi:MAG: alpha/beta hydrolase [Planctomycetota bacterium]
MTPLERQLVYPIPPVERSNWRPARFQYEDVWFQSEDGTHLHGWFFPRKNASRVILYCHPSEEQVADAGRLASALVRRLDAEVMVFDYRGYGKSAGKPYEAGVIADGRAAQRWLAERTGVAIDDIVLMGRSIGGGVATALAVELGARALVLQNTFTRLTEAAALRVPWFPVAWFMRNRFPSIKRIAKYHGPVFLAHGTQDAVVPVRMGRQLIKAAPGSHKVFFPIPGGYHDDPMPPDFYEDLLEFLDEVDADAGVRSEPLAGHAQPA